MKQSKTRQLTGLALTIGLGLMLTVVGPLTSITSASAESPRQRFFKEASQEFGVPQEILMSVSYNQSRWENHEAQASVAGGYGLMHLTTKVTAEDGRGDPSRPIVERQDGQARYTLDEAAELLDTSKDILKKDDRQNVRGGAALLAEEAKKDNNQKLPASIDDWYGAVAETSGIVDTDKATEFADNVYATIRSGASLTTTDGQSLQLLPQATSPDKSTLTLPKTELFRHSDGTRPECPPTVTCKFVPARFAQNTPGNPADYGNYDEANRPEDMKVKYIVIHDTEGSYESAISWFQDPRSYVAAHYVIRSSDGEVTQMVKTKDIGWHAGNWYMNMHSIGVEHEGFAAEGASWYTEAMYRSSAKLVRYLAHKYDVPLDREHIVGHEQYHGLTPARARLMHNDPGPYWDWEYYMDLLRAEPINSEGGRDAKAVTIAPRFAKNQQEVTDCTEGVCETLPKQGTNFVYLRTSPQDDAPLLSDAGLHPDGTPGTTDIDDWSAVATYGQRFAVAERKGNWTAIWFGGQKGWFKNPDSWRERTAVNAHARLVTPKTGKASIPLYGRPVPEADAYTNGVAPLTPVPLQYNLLGGQSYVAYDRRASNDYYQVLTFDRSAPGDGEVVVGNERYIPISYNHRQAFVKASDVEILE